MALFLTYKATFWLSGNPLLCNMGPQWQIYFLHNVQFKSLCWERDGGAYG